jgi:nicotinamidase-related amidase
MNTCLILIDIQNDYFPGGNMELEGAITAGENAGRLLAAVRSAKMPVIFIQHVSIRPGSTFMLPDTNGVKIHDCIAPIPDEPVVTKYFPNSFRGTTLRDLLKERNIENLIIAGMMSHMCVDATTRAAFDLGFNCVLAHDACSTRGLQWNGVDIPATHVHASFMAALGAVYAHVQSTDDVLKKINN